MEPDEPRKKPSTHEMGMALDTLSVDELTLRIELLRDEIGRLERAIAAKQHSRTAADAFFKR